MRYEADIEKVTEDIEDFKNRVDSIRDEAAPRDFVYFLTNLVSSVCNSNESIKKTFIDYVLSLFNQTAFMRKYHSSYRNEFVKMLMRLCNKNCVPPYLTYEKLVPLTTCEDKALRTIILNFLINDLKKHNNKGNPVELNKKTKTLLQKFITSTPGKNANFGTRIFVLLFNKNIWTDAFTANMIADCCLHDNKKVKTTALKFFLNKSAKSKNDSDSDSENETDRMEKVRKLKLAHRVGKKSQARQKHLDRELENLKRKAKKSKKEEIDHMTLECNVKALQLLRDPQMFAEKLFSKLKKAPYHIRLMMIELVSRLIGYHKLQLVNFYPYITAQLNPRTNDVTNLLVFAAQSSHEFVSPDDIQPVVKMIADQFANEGISGQGIALGLNSIREICARCPHAMPEDLLALLTEFRSYRDKNVVSACRSLIRLFRQINPSLLPKSERGRPTEANVDSEMQGDVSIPPKTFGSLNSVSFVPGAEAITKLSEKDKDEEGNEDDCEEEGDIEDDEDESEIEDDEDNSEVESDEEDIEIEEGENEEVENEEVENEEVENEEDDDEYETCSDISDEEDDSEGWIDINHSSEDEKEKEKDLRNPIERRKLAEELSYNHIFTDEEHLAIKKHNIMKAELCAKRAGKRKMENEIEIDSDTGEIIDPNAPAEFVTEKIITKMSKKLKSTREEKMACVQEGRIDRAKFGFSVNRFNPKASTTNREKAKKKNYMMISVSMMVSLSLCGIDFCGSDVGGFYGDPDMELLTRWYQLGSLQPFFREHSHIESKRREPYLIEDPYRTAIKKAITMRYRLLAYWYLCFRLAELEREPVVSPIWMHFSNSSYLDHDEMFLIGSEIVARPIVNPSCTSISVILPGADDIWFYYCDSSSSWKMYNSNKKIHIPILLESMPLFYHGGSCIFMKDGKCCNTVDWQNRSYSVYIFPLHQKVSVGYLYIDDYCSFNYKTSKHYCLMRFTFHPVKKTLICQRENEDVVWNMENPAKLMNILIIKNTSMSWAGFKTVTIGNQGAEMCKINHSEDKIEITELNMNLNSDQCVTFD